VTGVSADQGCNCDTCDFEFYSGHSHHVGASNLVCTQCDARYCLPTKSAMGPDFDEMIELNVETHEPCKQRGRKKKEPAYKRVRRPLGQYVLALSTGAPQFGVRYEGVEELKCATCDSKGLIVQNFKPGDPCPRCKRGKIKCIQVTY